MLLVAVAGVAGVAVVVVVVVCLCRRHELFCWLTGSVGKRRTGSNLLLVDRKKKKVMDGAGTRNHRYGHVFFSPRTRTRTHTNTHTHSLSHNTTHATHTEIRATDTMPL